MRFTPKENWPNMVNTICDHCWLIVVGCQTGPFVSKCSFVYLWAPTLTETWLFGKMNPLLEMGSLCTYWCRGSCIWNMLMCGCDVLLSVYSVGLCSWIWSDDWSELSVELICSLQEERHVRGPSSNRNGHVRRLQDENNVWLLRRTALGEIDNVAKVDIKKHILVKTMCTYIHIYMYIWICFLYTSVSN